MSNPRAAAPSLLEGPVAKSLLIFVLPILGTNILQSLNGSINAIWVGRYLGRASLLSVAVTTTYYNFGSWRKARMV